MGTVESKSIDIFAVWVSEVENAAKRNRLCLLEVRHSRNL